MGGSGNLGGNFDAVAGGSQRLADGRVEIGGDFERIAGQGVDAGRRRCLDKRWPFESTMRCAICTDTLTMRRPPRTPMATSRPAFV